MLNEFEQDTTGSPWVEECHVVAPGAGAGFLVDQFDAGSAGRGERVVDVVGLDGEVVDAGPALVEVVRDRSLGVFGGFEQFEIAVPQVEERDSQVPEGLLVGDGRVEERVVQVDERVAVLGRDAGVVEFHGGRTPVGGLIPGWRGGGFTTAQSLDYGMTPEELRADIPALDEAVYLNTGAGGPSPPRVVEATTAALEYHEYEAPAGDGTYAALFDSLDETRELVADHVNVAPESLALTQSTTDGIGLVAAAMDWQPGDVVVRTDQEHSAGILPWDRLEQTHGVEVRVVGAGGGHVDPDEWKTAVSDARLAVFSSLCWTDGCRLPVAELTTVAQDAGARVLVDAVQSVGQHPVDFSSWGADAVAAAGHKWLLGPTGTGFLHVTDEFARTLEPAQLGYMGVEDPEADDWSLKPDARRFETGSVSPVPHEGLREGIATIEAVGFDTIEARIERLTDRLKEGLGDRLVSGDAYESGLVSFAAEDPIETAERLVEAGIRVRDIPANGTVRASVHVFNTEGDVDALLDEL